MRGQNKNKIQLRRRYVAYKNHSINILVLDLPKIAREVRSQKSRILFFTGIYEKTKYITFRISNTITTSDHSLALSYDMAICI